MADSRPPTAQHFAGMPCAGRADDFVLLLGYDDANFRIQRAMTPAVQRRSRVKCSTKSPNSIPRNVLLRAACEIHT
jgi:hypothetical protein